MHLTYKNTKDEILAVMRQAKHAAATPASCPGAGVGWKAGA